MTQKERVEAIRELYPGYNKFLDSHCEHGEKYGVRRMPDAERIATGEKPKKASHPKLCVRIPKGYYNRKKFTAMLKDRGFNSITDWVKYHIKADLAAWEKERSPADAANTDEATENICNIIVAEEEPVCQP